MRIEGSVALVTGVNRGFGRQLTEQLLARGAAKVYAAARKPETITTPGVVPIALDITHPASVAAAAAAAADVNLWPSIAGLSHLRESVRARSGAM